MFNFFNKKPTVGECAMQAEITPVAEAGDYKAFLIQVLQSTEDFQSIMLKAGGTKALGEFVQIINDRIARKDFEDIFDVVDHMHREYGTTPKTRNLNAERVVICKGEAKSGYLFRFNP